MPRQVMAPSAAMRALPMPCSRPVTGSRWIARRQAVTLSSGPASRERRNSSAAHRMPTAQQAAVRRRRREPQAAASESDSDGETEFDMAFRRMCSPPNRPCLFPPCRTHVSRLFHFVSRAPSLASPRPRRCTVGFLCDRRCDRAGWGWRLVEARGTEWHDGKILALTDALGNPVRFRLMPGHRFDTVGVPLLLGGVALRVTSVSSENYIV